MALGRMTKSMSGMGGVKQQMPVAPPAPAPKKRSVLSRARAPAVVPQGSPQQPPAFNSAQLQQLQKEKVLREQQNQRYLGNPAAQDQLAQAPNNLARLSPTPTNSNSAPFTPQKVTDPAIRQALLNAPKPPAMTAPAKQATYKQPTMSQADVFNQSADINKQLGALEAQAQMAMANAPKMPAMRKGGAVKKKPGYAKGGMVMANCGASMKPQQKAKK
jgi:hypothetical protein